MGAMASLLLALLLQDPFTDLFQSLADDQKAACLKPWDDESRDAENFTPGKRPGLLIQNLTEEQAGRLDKAIRAFLSADGYKQAMEVAAQSHKKEGLKAYYLNYFGDPTKDKAWTFRVSEHHLTIVHVTSDPARFGPILLGANPPEIWKEQEEAAIACFAKLSEDEKKKVVIEGKAASGRTLGDKGVPIESLSADAKAAAIAMIEARFKLFSDDQQKKLRAILQAQGGVEKLRLAFFGEMTKRCADGGRADWKIGSKDFLCDYASSGGHIHMTLRGRAP